MHNKSRALAQFAFNMNASAMSLHDFFRDKEAQSESAIRRNGNGALETLKNSRVIFFRDTDAVIFDLNAR